MHHSYNTVLCTFKSMTSFSHFKKCDDSDLSPPLFTVRTLLCLQTDYVPRGYSQACFVHKSKLV